MVGHANPLRGFQLDVETTTRARLKMEAAVIVSLAGPIAQRRFNKRGYRHYHGADDRHKAVNLIGYFAGSNEEIKAYFKWLYVRTDGLVNRWWPLIGHLAQELLDRKNLSKREVRITIKGWMQKISVGGMRPREGRRIYFQ